MSGAAKRLLGVFWTFVGRAARRLGAFVFLLLIAQEIGQAAVGLVATPLVYYYLFDAVALNVMRRRIVQVETLEPDDLRFAAGFGLVAALIGGAAALVLATLAGLVSADGSAAGSLAPLMAGFVAVTVWRGLQNAHHAALLRAERYRALAGLMTLATLSGGLVGWIASLAGAGPWSFVVYQAVNALALSIGFRLRSQAGALSPLWRRACWERHRAFLRPALWSEGVQAGNRQMDLLILPAFLAPAALGLYFMARRALETVSALIDSSIADPAFAAYARNAADPAALAQARSFFLALVLLLAAPTYVGLGLVAPDLFAAVMGADWREAGEMLQLLAPLGVLLSLRRSFNTLFMAIGRIDLVMRLALATAAVGLLALPAAATLGISEVIWAMIAIGVVVLAVQLTISHRLTALRPEVELRAAASVAVATAAMAAAVALVRSEAEATGVAAASAAGLALAVGCGACVYAALAAALNPGLVRRAWAQLRARRRRRPPPDA